MASPCEVLIDTTDRQLAEQLAAVAYFEARRIEQKYSRYLSDNLCSRINLSQGQRVASDDETYRLLCFADSCYQLSEGLFDITSGVLRQAWKFDGSDRLPEAQQVAALLPLIGWQQVRFDQHSIILPPGFELDFGGIGKEYAVDAVATRCLHLTPQISVVVNFGGDIQVTRPRVNKQCWHIGIENPDSEGDAVRLLRITQGGLATSGDARRFLYKDGVRYSHILNPQTGYPVADAPRSVTVAADHCVQAGILATLALLKGKQAEEFLNQQGVMFWLQA
ncbi:FAD:protein FMN transferase [Lacimicrobium alkaliphilum]|uniref:FAD:protein FMN transferase n=1 Tax=Lacimicrobium alkaliphilum TaxID=1526571 RepID=A0A0U3B5P9_9ALTE|nr:FAD:protein FMN transferase [Lacimicrobium alkaliphilum]ALT00433.1 thiamine biosynthesis protein ApbE [Lacimicrobium alkaliphilum]